MSSEILVEKDGSIARIVLNRTEKRNAQGLTFSANMLTALDQVEKDPDVKVAILASSGPVFGGGGDLDEIMSVTDTDSEWELELIRGYNQVISRLYHFDRPLIAAVNGPAVGGGACLALACDFAVASERGSYHFAFGRIGLSGADMGAATLLHRAIGSARASYYLLTGGVIDAQLGKSLGLFCDVVNSEEFAEFTRELAVRIAGQSRRANTITKLAIRRGIETSLDASLEYEAYLQSFAFRSAEHKQRLGEFIKRKRG